MTSMSDNLNLFNIIERLKEGLIAYSTSSEGPDNFNNEEYKQSRKILIGIDNISNKLPDFIKTYRSLDEFWGYIKEYSSTYAGRRQYLGEVFNPLLDELEKNDSLFINDYEEVCTIGAGGFGEVKRLRHKLLDVDFAFKFYSPIFSNEGDRDLERFFREAKILFKLFHPNIIKIYDIGLINGKPFIRMELFEGRNLNEVLRDFGKFPIDRSLLLIYEIAEALDYAHNIGVVHRDIRPSNIMIAKPRQVRIIDFGLGIFLENELISRLTRTGHNIAGGHFTAPELIKNPRLIDAKTDIYSLGAVWYNLVTGQVPAGSGISQTLMSINGIDKGITDIILRCLEDSDNRYQSIQDLLVDLKSIRESFL